MSHNQYQGSGPPHHANNMNNLPPLQPPRQYSPSPYRQSPSALSPGVGSPYVGPRISPNPTSPYAQQSPYGPNSPYATSPPAQYLSAPGTPNISQAPQPFHQPQPYHPPNNLMAQQQQQQQQQARQSSMPPPKYPYSKTQDGAPDQLEKADPRGADINQISDVLSGAGVDLRAEEDNLLSSYRQPGTSFGNSLNSQGSSTLSPGNSFGQWPPGVGAHGAFQGTGPLSQPVTEQDLEAELNRKHERAARAVAEAQQYHLTDPFLSAAPLRTKLAHHSYKNGVTLNVEGLYDKIPETPQNVSRTVMTGAHGEAIGAAQANSLLGRDAPFVDILTLFSLAAQERLRGILEDAFAMAKMRQTTAEGVVSPEFADIAKAIGNSKGKATTVVPKNVTGTAWEAAPAGKVGSKTVPGQQSNDREGRLPTPPADVPLPPQATIVFNNVKLNCLKRKAMADLKDEEARIKKRNKRKQATNSASGDSPAQTLPPPMPEKMTKKERDRLNKMGQSEDVLHRKANETASMALFGGKKKYSWMTGGGGGGGGGGGAMANRVSTPTPVVGTPGASGDKAPAVDAALRAKDKNLGVFKESGDVGKGIQTRDVLIVLDADGRDRRTAGVGLARQNKHLYGVDFMKERIK